MDSLQKEIDILSVYLPEELSDEEIEKVINETIKELNVDSIKGMGMVIKAVGAKIGSAADMSKSLQLLKKNYHKAHMCFFNHIIYW